MNLERIRYDYQDILKSLKIFFILPMKLTLFTPLSLIISPVTPPPLSPIIKHNNLADPPSAYPDYVIYERPKIVIK